MLSFSHKESLCCCRPVARLSLTICDPMDCGPRPGLPVPHSLPEFAQDRGSAKVGRWCYLTISSWKVLFFCLHSFPVPGSFPTSRIFASGGQSIKASASTSVLPMNIQSWFLLGLTCLISLQSNRLSGVFSNAIQMHQFFGAQSSLWSNSHICTWPLEKPWLWLDGNCFRLSAKWCLYFLIFCLGLS